VAALMGTEEAILIYQAFKPEIRWYVVSYQKFTGCLEYSPTCMTWIKTIFLWMMFRSFCTYFLYFVDLHSVTDPNRRGWGEKLNLVYCPQGTFEHF